MQIRPTLSSVASAGELRGQDESPISFLCSPRFHSLSNAAPSQSAGQFSTDLLIGASRILSVKDEFDELRSRCNQQDDLTTDIDYFISCKHPRNCRPVLLLIRSGSRPAAALLLHEICFVWLGTRLCAGGDSAGDGLLIAPEQQREVFLRRAIHELVNIQKRFHTVRLCVKNSAGETLVNNGAPGVRSKFVERAVKHRLALADTYTGMLASFGPRTRRSLRTKRRRLEDTLRPDFLSGLQPEQALSVMGYLRLRSSSPFKWTWYLHARRKFLHSRADAFAMALRSHDGTWLSFLSGWRRNGTTYVDMQMNHSAFKRESLSAVMRAFLLEHEIGVGQKYLEFVGGCSVLLQRYCSPGEKVVDLLVSRFTIEGWCLKQAVERFCDTGFKQWLYYLNEVDARREPAAGYELEQSIH
jgi:hypothetical protein